jgi:hypothetical protein
MQEVRTPYRTPRLQYEILWERESDLAERIANAWSDAGQKKKNDLGDIMKSLGRVMSMFTELE